MMPAPEVARRKYLSRCGLGQNHGLNGHSRSRNRYKDVDILRNANRLAFTLGVHCRACWPFLVHVRLVGVVLLALRNGSSHGLRKPFGPLLPPETILAPPLLHSSPARFTLNVLGILFLKEREA